MSYEHEEYMGQINQALNEERQKNLQLQHMQSSIFKQEDNANLIEAQLNLDKELDRIYHILKGDRVFRDAKGNFDYKTNPNAKERTLTDYGVDVVMGVAFEYINKNTLLGYYEPEQVLDIMYNFGESFTDLLYLKYEEIFYHVSYEKHAEELGYKDMKKVPESVEQDILTMIFNEKMNKIKFYMMIVRAIVDMVHSSYTRAIWGAERESLRKAMYVTQTNPQQGMPMMPGGMPQKKAQWYNPFSW